MTHEELIQAIADYLTKQFIVSDINSVPRDECHREARAVLAIIAEATKEATYDMIAAAFDSRSEDTSSEACWTAMHAASPLWPKEQSK